MTEVIIGSRESKLAVLQSEMVKSYIEQKNREENAGSEITVNILTLCKVADIYRESAEPYYRNDRKVQYNSVDRAEQCRNLAGSYCRFFNILSVILETFYFVLLL